MPHCGSQVILCDMPINFDTYKGCSHQCTYCYVTRKGSDMKDIGLGEGVKELRAWIDGKRGADTNWADWKAPIHWGSMSDPFQPCERHFKNSMACLELFAETQYPVVFSSKGAVLRDKVYLDALAKCNVVGQISLVAPSYDKYDKGAPTFDERIEVIAGLVKVCKRVIVRAQPFHFKDADEVVNETVPKIRAAGAYGLTIEGWKYFTQQPDTVKVGTDFLFDLRVLTPAIKKIGAAVRAAGMKYYVAENRLRFLGDSVSCCGIDGLEGFRGNKANMNHLLAGDYEATEGQLKKGTGDVFAAMGMRTPLHKMAKPLPYDTVMKAVAKTELAYELMGIETPKPQADLFASDESANS
jgi:hypothetical protein